MAGRGTDIKPAPECRRGRRAARAGHRAPRGPPHRPAARRPGRPAGRPGQRQFFLSLEDELLEGLGPKRQNALAEFGRAAAIEDWQKFQPLFLRAERRRRTSPSQAARGPDALRTATAGNPEGPGRGPVRGLKASEWREPLRNFAIGRAVIRGGSRCPARPSFYVRRRLYTSLARIRIARSPSVRLPWPKRATFSSTASSLASSCSSESTEDAGAATGTGAGASSSSR